MAISQVNSTTFLVGSSADTFEDLVTFMAANPGHGSYGDSYIHITSHVRFASQAKLLKSTSLRSTIIFGTSAGWRRMTSDSHTQANKGEVDFGHEGTLITEGVGYIGNAEPTFKIQFTADYLAFTNGFTDGNLTYLDLFYRSSNDISSVNIAERLTVTLNNTFATSMGLLIDPTKAVLGSVEFIVGDNCTEYFVPWYDGPKGVVIPPITHAHDPIGDSYLVRFHRNWDDTADITFFESVFLENAPIHFHSNSSSGTVYVDNPQLPDGYNAIISQNKIGWEIRVTFNFEAPEYDDAGGWTMRFWDDEGDQVNQVFTVGSIGVQKILWRSQAVGTSVFVQHLNANVRFRKAAFVDAELFYAEYSTSVIFLSPPLADANYTSDQSGNGNVSLNYATDTITLTGAITIDELYDYCKYSLALTANMDEDSFLNPNGAILDIGAWDISGVEYLTEGTKFTILKSTGTLTGAGDMSNITLDADLHMDTGADSVLAFNNVTVTGLEYNDDALHTLLINATNGSSLTSGDPGTGNGETDIQSVVLITFTDLIVGGEFRIYDDELGTTNMGTELDGIEVLLSDTFVYTHDSSANNIKTQHMANGYEENISSFTLGATPQTYSIALEPETNI